LSWRRNPRLMKEHDMKRTENTVRLIALGRVSRETRSIKGSEPEVSNPVLVYNPS
jgi:hypothetical protein